MGAFLGAAGHAAWLARSGPEGRIMVSPTLQFQNVPQYMAAQPPHDPELYGDGGVMAVGEAAGIANLYSVSMRCGLAEGCIQKLLAD